MSENLVKTGENAEIDLSYNDRGPNPSCPRCGGRGSWYAVPPDVQRREIEAGLRKVVSRRMCDCTTERGRERGRKAGADAVHS